MISTTMLRGFSYFISICTIYEYSSLWVPDFKSATAQFAYICTIFAIFFSVWYRFQVSCISTCLYLYHIHFLLRMVQISSFLLFNLPIFVPYTHFLLRMVQISSFLLINLLISVPSYTFLPIWYKFKVFTIIIHIHHNIFNYSIILWYIFNLCQPVSCLFLYESTILYHNNCNIHTNLWCKLFMQTI